jgi:hypothetical protein
MFAVIFSLLLICATSASRLTESNDAMEPQNCVCDDKIYVLEFVKIKVIN